MTVFVEAITVASPFAPDWSAMRERFALGQAEPDEDWRAKPDCLNPRAARRLSPQIRLALQIAEGIAPVLADEAGWVFASSIGEGETLQVILEALRTAEMLVQPLRFQNAVHNAASGQWTIAAGLTGPTTSIGAYAETVGAGVLKSSMQASLERRGVGLVLYDVPLPDPLDAIHPLGQPIGAGIALSPEQSQRSIARLDIVAGRGTVSQPLTELGRAMIATLNPIAAVTPLLERLAGLGEGPVVLGLHGGGALTVTVLHL